MRRLSTIILAVATLAGCGDNSSKPLQVTPDAPPDTQSTPASTDTPSTPAAPRARHRHHRAAPTNSLTGYGAPRQVFDAHHYEGMGTASGTNRFESINADEHGRVISFTIGFNASPPLDNQTAAGEARSELPSDARLVYDLRPGSGCEQRQYQSRTLGRLLGPAAAAVVIELQPKDAGGRYNPQAVYFATLNPSHAGDRSVPC